MFGYLSDDSLSVAETNEHHLFVSTNITWVFMKLVFAKSSILLNKISEIKKTFCPARVSNLQDTECQPVDRKLVL